MRIRPLACYPVNFVFDSDGAQRFALAASLYREKNPLHVLGSDDVKNMYNSTSRIACFSAAQRRRPSHVPYLRYFYGQLSYIIMVRSEGRMLSALARSGCHDDDEVQAVSMESVADTHPDIGYHLREVLHAVGLAGDALLKCLTHGRIGVFWTALLVSGRATLSLLTLS